MKHRRWYPERDGFCSSLPPKYYHRVPTLKLPLVCEYHIERAYFSRDGGTKAAGYTYRFNDDTDLPIAIEDGKGGVIDPIARSANHIRTFWNSPWSGDLKMQTYYHTDDGEIDIDGRDRAGMLVSNPVPDEEYVRAQIVKYLLNYTVGILADGSHARDRHWRYETKFSNN